VLSELIGTGLLTLLGCGVVANAVLAKNKGFGGGFLMINFGWGLAVMCGIIVAARTGAHINPAVTFGVLATGADSYASGIPVTAGNTLAYLIGQFAGAFLGAVLAWAAYRDQFDHPDSEPAAKLGTFSTGPEIRKPVSNLVTEIIGTFVLVFVILGIGQPANVSAMQDGATLLGASAFLVVPLLVVGIGASLGGPTGYAINPARDLGPRIAHAVLPIRRKGSSDWGYSWIPVVGPLIGGVLAGLVAGLVNFV
jgi:glycerol uptake facilitator protein